MNQDKFAQTDKAILKEIKERWSTRSFSSEMPSNEMIHLVLEAARWAPSANNEQPWRFIIGQKNGINYHKIFDSLNPWNQTWVSGTPILIVGLAHTIHQKNGQTNHWAEYDLGQSVAYINLQAQNQGLFMHQMAGFNRELLMQSFDLDMQSIPKVVFALGFKGNGEGLHEKYVESEKAVRTRKPMEELILGSDI